MARVLVVDDDADVRRAVTLRLRRDGHDVVEACDGQAGLAHLRRAGVDVVVLDLLMPVMDGYEFLEQMDREAATAGVPVVVLSGRDGSDGIVRALGHGAADYVVKPFHARELSARVDLALRREQARGDLRRLALLAEQLAGRRPAARRAGLRRALEQWPQRADDDPVKDFLAACVGDPPAPVPD